MYNFDPHEMQGDLDYAFNKETNQQMQKILQQNNFLVDRKGRRINKNNWLINKNGNIIDKNGLVKFDRR